MSFFKHVKMWGPLLSIAIVGVSIGSSLAGYELPKYELEAQAAEVVDDRPMPVEAENETVIGVGSWELDDGVYRGKGVGYSGDVVVDVTIADKTITQIDIVSTSDDEAYFKLAKAVINSIISSQSLEVDTVSGATFSSNGIIKAVRNALTGEEDNSEVQNQGEGQGSTTVSDVEEPAAYKDGEYYGTGTGFGGQMTVKVVIKDGKIASVEVVSHKDDPEFFNKAKVLVSKIVEKQSTNVDTVSGATYSSVGIINATRDALKKAAVDKTANDDLNNTVSTPNEKTDSEKPVNIDKIPEQQGMLDFIDGTYTGTGEGWGGDIVVSITIKNKTMTDIVVNSHDDETEAFYNRAVAIISDMIAKQTADVDVVSGATFSSEGIIEAVQNAFEAARAATDAAKEDDKGPQDPENNNAENSERQDNDQASQGADDEDAKTEPSGGETNHPSDPSGETDSEDSSKDDTEQDGDTGSDSDPNVPEEVVTVYKDGTYSGSARCVDSSEDDEFDYELGLTVTVEKDRIVNITNVTENGVAYTAGTENKSYIKKAFEGTKKYTGLLAQMLARDTFDEDASYDAVSGATYSSEAVYNAIKDAMRKARK